MKIRTLALLACFAVSPVLGQETRGSISGIVTDPQSAAVVGATVLVTNTETNTSAHLTTNAIGFYQAPLLLPGNYRVTAEASGFKKTIRSGITLQVSTQLEINIQLEVGAVSESVTVNAEAPLIDTTTATSGRVLNAADLSSLPMFGGNVTLLTRLTPGVQYNGNTAYVMQGFVNNGSNYFAPGNVGGNEWSIDGISNNGSDRRLAQTPNMDMLQEVKVETSNFDASFGHSTGLNVSMMTKAGTNAMHGTANYQHWQGRWQAANFFQRQTFWRQVNEARAAGNTALADRLASQPIQPASFSHNRSATFGAPVYIPKLVDGRNKLFFFFNWSKVRDLRGSQGTVLQNVPTMANREGDFSQLLQVDAVRFQVYDPASTAPDTTRTGGHIFRTPFPGNILPKSRIANPMYDAYTAFYPRPNSLPLSPSQEPINAYNASSQTARQWYHTVGNRFDYNATDRHRFFFRWSWSDFYEGAGDWTYETKPCLQCGDTKRYTLAGTLDWTFAKTASTVWNASIGSSSYKDADTRQVPTSYKPSDVGLPTYMDDRCDDQCHLPVISISGYSGLSNTFPTWNTSRVLNGRLNLTHIRGSHSLRAGFDARAQYRNQFAGGNTSGTFSFSNSFTRKADDTAGSQAGDRGLSWAAFMLGVPNNTGMTISKQDSLALMNPYYAWFLQDTWRVTRRLTLNLGLRLEYEMGPTERYNRMQTGYDPNAELPIAAPAQAAYARNPIPELPASQFVVRGGSLYSGLTNAKRQWWRNELMYLPRASAAWQIRSSTVIRVGYGWYFDTLNVTNDTPSQLGYSRTTTTILTNDLGLTWNAGYPARGISPLTDPFPVRANGTRFDEPVKNAWGPTAVAGTGYSYINFDRQHPRIQRWRAGVQQQLGQTMVFEVAYSGMYGDRIGVGQAQDRLPEKYYSTGTVRNQANADFLNANVANPFNIANFASLRTSDPVIYDRISTQSFFTSAQIQRHRLLRPFLPVTGLTDEAAPIGKARTHALETTFERRLSKGFNLNFSYVFMRSDKKDFFYNDFDALPTQWYPTTNARPHRVTTTGIYQLPFGKGRTYLRSGLLSYIAGGWQIAATYEWQNGPILEWGNLFFYGNPDDIKAGERTIDRWFNIDAGFERNSQRTPAPFQARTFPRRIEGLRGDGNKLLNANVMKEIPIRERLTFQMRLDALNALNRSHFATPNLDPVSTNFGRVTANTQTTNRFIQIQGRIQF